MSRVAVVTDSTAYIPKELLQAHQITVAPQMLIWDGETFEDGVDIQPAEFYTRLQKAAVMPTSSQVSLGTFKQIFSALGEKGYDVLAVLISSKLSGTIDSARQAQSMLPDVSIEIIDSYSASMALGYQVLAAARAAQEGASLRECAEIAEQASQRTGLILSVDTLEFLHRGGRIGGAQRFLGTALNIKPLLEICDGRLEPLERVRTRKKVLGRMIELVEERVDGRTPVRLACVHANAWGEAREVLDQAAQQLHATETILTDVSPVIGTHVGPGTVALCYMAGM